MTIEGITLFRGVSSTDYIAMKGPGGEDVLVIIKDGEWFRDTGRIPEDQRHLYTYETIRAEGCGIEFNTPTTDGTS